MKLHKIELTGYCAKSPEGPALYLGTAGSYGNEQLAVTLGKGWDGLTVTATFQPAGVTVLVPGDGTLDVPWEATETALDAAKGRIVFEGVTDGRVLISTDIPYAVGSHSDTEGSNSQPPTPSEWEQYVDEVKGDADRAEQAAKDAEATLQDVKNAGAQAVTDIGTAKDSALDAVAKAGEEAAGSITADVQAAKDAAAAAAQSAKDAAAELPKVQQAAQAALDDIATERENSLTALEDEAGKQQSAVAGAGASALEAIQQAGQTVTEQITQTGATQVGAVQSAGTTQVGLVNVAGQQQAENIAQAGSQQVQAVQAAGMAAVGTVNDARDDAVEEIETANAHSPQINQDTGYWQTWAAETGQYVDTATKAQGPQGNKGDTGNPGPQGETGATPQLTIGTVTTLDPGEDATVTITGTAEAPVLNFGIPKGEQGDGSTSGGDLPATTAADSGKAPTVNAAGTGYELTGPYAPLSAAIRPTASGNPVNITDSVEWPLQGLKVYGKSTQVTTTGAQLLPTEQIKETTANGITFSPVGNGAYHVYGTATAEATGFFYGNNFELLPGTYTMSVSREIDISKIKVCLADLKGISYVDIGRNTNKATQEIKSAVQVALLLRVYPGQTVDYTVYPMLVEGSTAKPWEPYTGGKPSPSPEYPQPIVSAGDGGSIDLTVSNGASLSQSMTIATPTGLPGIPVDSGGNYTDAEGQQSACDVKDYGTGKYTQMVGHIESYNSENITTSYMSTTGQLSTGAEVYYVLDEPVVTDISADELTAYRALHTYDNATVVSTAEDVAGLEVRYVANAQKYIDDRLAAAESHIQEIAAAQLNAQTGG